jgi:hypothetical protein
MVCGTSRHRVEVQDINPTEAGRFSLAVMPKTTRYKHKEEQPLI